MAAQQPASRRAIADHVSKPGVDHLDIVLDAPIRVLQGEVERMAETVRRRITGSAGRMYVGLRNCITGWIVRIKNPPPVGVDLVHVVAIPQWMRAVDSDHVGDL